MGEYLEKKLQKESLVDIIQKCKNALNKGYLSDSSWEKSQIEKVRKCRDLSWFCRERKKAQGRYDEFCHLLERELTKIEKLNNPIIRLSKLTSLLENALRIDGKRRSFDYTFNLRGNILEHHITQLKKFLQKRFSKTQEKNKLNTWLSNLVNISPYKSYSYLELTDLLQLSNLCPSLAGFKNSNQISRHLIQKAKKDPHLTKMLKKCLSKYARGSVGSLCEKLLLYAQYKGKEEAILRQLSEQKMKTNKRKKETIEEIGKFLSSKEKKEFRGLVEKITQLIFINEYEDPFRNNNMDGLADYFLRKNVAICLCQLGRVKTQEPMDYPQRFLLKKAKKVLKEEK